MTRFRHALMFSMLATGTAFAIPAAAATLVDTGTPTSGTSYSLGGTSLAGLFTLGAAATITSVEGFIGGPDDTTGTISIYTGGVDPQFSGLLFSANFAKTNNTTGTWQGVFGRSWNLAAGQYWAVFETGGTLSRMFNGAPNPLSQYAVRGGGVAWSQLGSGAGLGVRITNNVASPPVSGAVPEPGTWAMMLIGFGAIGGALRARRRVAVSYG